MANAKALEYKGYPLRRKGNIIYYGNMSDKYIIMLQIMDSEDLQDLSLSAFFCLCPDAVVNTFQHKRNGVHGIGLEHLNIGKNILQTVVDINNGVHIECNHHIATEFENMVDGQQ